MALVRLEEFEAEWGKRYPAIAQGVAKSLGPCRAVLRVRPRPIRKMGYTTNAVEALHRSSSGPGHLFCREVSANLILLTQFRRLPGRRTRPTSHRRTETRGGSDMNILVVEDEALVALLDSCHVDAALLDIWLKNDEFVYPAARKLASRGVPFAFVSARAADGIDPAFADRPLIPKPMDERRVKGWLEEVVSGRGQREARRSR